ncbi:MAG: hypothetical protein JWN74_262 [Acidobacteriaceae bacterium]|nr:hypothetical protein [Acidobacteriaceae bacterium]
MENISQLVESSLARHGVPTSFDHLRLQWSSWVRCESSFSVLLAPAKPGIFALGEEIVPLGESVELRAAALSRVEGSVAVLDGHNRAECVKRIAATAESLELRASSPVGKRMLALFQISDTDDLGMALGRLFLPGNPLRERLAAERCFARYAVIEDPVQRQSASAVFQRWIHESAETASGISGQQDPCGADRGPQPARFSTDGVEDILVRESVRSDTASTLGQGFARECVVRKSEPSTSFAWGTEVQDREVSELKRSQPLPSGF